MNGPAAYAGALVRLTSVILLVLLSLSIPRPSRADPAVSVLPDCLGKPQARPTAIVLTCADANMQLTDLKWTGWGEAFAAAVGSMSLNDCSPSCAAGHMHKYRAVAIVSGKQTCPGGTIAYMTVTYGFIGASPFAADARGTTNPTQNFPCKK